MSSPIICQGYSKAIVNILSPLNKEDIHTKHLFGHLGSDLYDAKKVNFLKLTPDNCENLFKLSLENPHQLLTTSVNYKSFEMDRHELISKASIKSEPKTFAKEKKYLVGQYVWFKKKQNSKQDVAHKKTTSNDIQLPLLQEKKVSYSGSSSESMQFLFYHFDINESNHFPRWVSRILFLHIESQMEQLSINFRKGHRSKNIILGNLVLTPMSFVEIRYFNGIDFEEFIYDFSKTSSSKVDGEYLAFSKEIYDKYVESNIDLLPVISEDSKVEDLFLKLGLWTPQKSNGDITSGRGLISGDFAKVAPIFNAYNSFLLQYYSKKSFEINLNHTRFESSTFSADDAKSLLNEFTFNPNYVQTFIVNFKGETSGNIVTIEMFGYFLPNGKMSFYSDFKPQEQIKADQVETKNKEYTLEPFGSTYGEKKIQYNNSGYGFMKRRMLRYLHLSCPIETTKSDEPIKSSDKFRPEISEHLARLFDRPLRSRVFSYNQGDIPITVESFQYEKITGKYDYL